MIAHFHDFTLLEDDNLVSIFDRRESVSDDNASLLTCLHESIQSLLHLVFALGVECAGRLIQEDDLGLTHEGSGDSDALLLAT